LEEAEETTFLCISNERHLGEILDGGGNTTTDYIACVKHVHLAVVDAIASSTADIGSVEMAEGRTDKHCQYHCKKKAAFITNDSHGSSVDWG
jgi:hypothetical protein